MAKDDFFVIAYRILAYLYQCMKEGERPNMEDISFQRLGIPERYWYSVIRNLRSGGYIRGIEIVEGIGGTIFLSEINPEITIAGIEFLQENSSMAKAKQFLKELKEIIPGI